MALAFLAPYAALFLAFVVYPIGYALYMARTPSLYAELIADPLYVSSAVNTVVFVALGVNVMMFGAFVLSGFFVRRRWWISALLAIYLLPWMLPAVQTAISFRWMLSGEYGLIDRVLFLCCGIDGPLWFHHRWLAIGSNMIAYAWKWLPFWTAIFLAGRISIPQDVEDAATVDGAIGIGRFTQVTFPLLANLYLVCTLLGMLWALGDFTTVYFVSGGAPVWSSDVLTTLGFRYAFDAANPALAVAAVISLTPIVVPIVILLVRSVRVRQVQL